MGCCSSATDVSEPSKVAQQSRDAEIARKMQAGEDRAARAHGHGRAEQAAAWGAPGPGRQLGGGGGGCGSGAGADAQTAAERRQMALEAAERRQQNMPGVSKQRVAEMREKQLKDEYLGKVTECYRRKKLDVPMCFSAASSEQLRKHWDLIRISDLPQSAQAVDSDAGVAAPAGPGSAQAVDADVGAALPAGPASQEALSQEACAEKLSAETRASPKARPERSPLASCFTFCAKDPFGP